MKPNTIFYYINNLSFFKEELDFTDEEIASGYDPYMINRWLSMSDMNIPLINNINKYNMPKEIHYKYLLNAIPQRKQFLTYIKKDDKMFEVKKMLVHMFECNMREAEDYLNRLDDTTIQEIINSYEFGK